MSQPSSSPPSAVVRLGAHIPALDAVRGIAILLVLLYHFAGHGGPDDKKPPPGALFKLFGQGSFGVDLFFVLSGFLITGILFESKERARYYRNFYIRRSLRIFPLYYGVLFVTFVALPLLSGGAVAPFPETADHQIWLWLYGSNFYQAWKNSYPLTGFNHFWSLAVEEHFYLVWPLVIYACSRRTAMAVSGFCIVAAIALRVCLAVFGGYQANDPAIYALTPSRLDALALGSLIALAVRGPGGVETARRWVYGGAVVSVLALALMYGWRPAGDTAARALDSVRYSAFAGMFAGIMMWSVTVPPGGFATLFWNSAVLRFFGKYSYGLYVFHFLLLPFYYELLPPEKLEEWTGSATVARLLFMLTAIGASIGVALLSWNLYEKHFLKLKDVLAGPPPKPSKTISEVVVTG